MVTTPSVSGVVSLPQQGPELPFEWLGLLQRSGGSLKMILFFIQVEAPSPGQGSTKGLRYFLERG